jgi:uncharacterized protein (DUF1697 family)
MPVFVALLRGINVGGNNRLSMESLQAICETLGHTSIRTYIQSGNVVFRTKRAKAEEIASALHAALEKTAGIKSDVVLRTREQLQSTVDKNPFRSRKDVPGNKLLVTFFDREPTTEAAAKVNSMKLPPEEFQLLGSDLYVFYPNGAGRSKFPAASVAKMLNASGTARNWNTVLKLLEMTAEVETSGR